MQIFSWFTAAPVLCSIKGFQLAASLSHTSRYNDNMLCLCFEQVRVPQASRKFLRCSFIKANCPTLKKIKGGLDDAHLKTTFRYCYCAETNWPNVAAGLQSAARSTTPSLCKSKLHTKLSGETLHHNYKPLMKSAFVTSRWRDDRFRHDLFCTWWPIMLNTVYSIQQSHTD